MMGRLKKDVVSNKGKIYGKEGELVKIISDCNPAMIVENKNGNRYSVRIENIVLE